MANGNQDLRESQASDSCAIADRVAVWTLRRADRVRVVSMTLGDLARSAGYGGPLDRYVAFSNYSAFLDGPVVRPPEEPRVLFVGVLEKHKAVDTLLDAWHQVLKSVPKAKLEIVGTGRLENDLQDRVQQEGLGDSVHFRAPVPRPELRGLIDSLFMLGAAVAYRRVAANRSRGDGALEACGGHARRRYPGIRRGRPHRPTCSSVRSSGPRRRGSAKY